MSEKYLDSELPADEDNQIEEASAQEMPVGTEADSVKSVAATDVTNKAPKRTGDKDGKDEPSGSPKTKASYINAMYGKLAGMKKTQLQAMYSKFESVEVELEGEAVELPEMSYDFSDDLKALVESEATLSDEFKAKTAVIFETAVSSKISETVERLEDEYESRLNEELEETRSALVENIDSYLNYVVEGWMKDNQVAVEKGLRAEIAEGFMSKLRDLFEESYIEVPETKVDLVDELAEQVEELEEKLNSQTSSVLEMSGTIETLTRANIVREASRDLADTQQEKLASLVESLDFEDEAAFSQKVKTVKESYFAKEVTEEVAVDALNEEWAPASPEVTGTMDSYLSAIKKSHK
tara:strand:+ start:2550 stop:3605 length:1056 start_codon:yes stop_codon:yes gene_type:complete